MKRYLLDTCICVFLFRQKYGIAEKLGEKIAHLRLSAKSASSASQKFDYNEHFPYDNHSQHHLHLRHIAGRDS